MSLTETYNDGFKRIDPQALDFKDAPYFRKIENIDVNSVRVATATEQIQTIVDGKDETPNTANVGDYIITGVKGEQYVLTSDKFNKMYEINPENHQQYRSKNHGYAIQVSEDVVISAPWGEDQKIYAGGGIFKSTVDGDVFGKQASTFEATFGRESANGDVIALSESLENQLTWAESLGELNHMRDIQNRIAQNSEVSLATTVFQNRANTLENK
mgnify:CR=1 FL=1